MCQLHKVIFKQDIFLRLWWKRKEVIYIFHLSCSSFCFFSAESFLCASEEFAGGSFFLGFRSACGWKHIFVLFDIFRGKCFLFPIFSPSRGCFRMECLFDLLIFEEIFGTIGRFRSWRLGDVFWLTLFLLELLFNLCHHFSEFFDRLFFGLALALSFGFSITLLTFHEDDILIGLISMIWITFAV